MFTQPAPKINSVIYSTHYFLKVNGILRAYSWPSITRETLEEHEEAHKASLTLQLAQLPQPNGRTPNTQTTRWAPAVHLENVTIYERNCYLILDSIAYRAYREAQLDKMGEVA